MASQNSNLINIIGDGSIGHLWTGYLSKAGYALSLYSHSEKANRQVTLKAPAFEYQFNTKTKGLAQFNSKAATIICAKAFTLESICKQLAQNRSHPECIILMMNGLGLTEISQKWLPLVPVYQASTTQAAKLSTAPLNLNTTISHTGYGETLIGSIQPAETCLNKIRCKKARVAITELISLLNHALPPVVWSKNHHQNLWYKLLVNALINPVTAVHNVNNGDLVTDKQLNSLVNLLAEELSPLLQHLPIKQNTSSNQSLNINWQTIANRALKVAETTAKNSSSMRQDILHNRKTEIDFITGYILKKAQRFGCRLPSHQTLYEQIKRLEFQTQTSVTK